MAMIKRLTNKITNLFRSKQEQIPHNYDYDFCILVKLLIKIPEDVLIEILLRVPADVLVLLCPIWRNLISSPVFIDLHLKRANSNHIVQYAYSDGYHSKAKLIVVDCTTKKCMDLVYDYEPHCCECTLWGSCGGLLAFWSRPHIRNCISIVNPITGENRDISAPPNLGNPCGFFFNRFQGRYKLLYVGYDKSYENVVYYTFDLSESGWRKLDLINSRSNSRPNSRYPGVIVGDALHWIADDTYYNTDCSKMIVVFKIETEEFYSLPHPPVTSTRCRSGIHASFKNLIAKDGKLCFCQVIVEEIVVDLWILEDYENWGSWVKKFKVNLVSINKRFRRMASSHILFRGLRIGSPGNGGNEILVICIYSFFEGFYGYHLETHCSRQLETTLPRGSMYGLFSLPYTKTMLSPMF